MFQVKNGNIVFALLPNEILANKVFAIVDEFGEENNGVGNCSIEEIETSDAPFACFTVHFYLGAYQLPDVDSAITFAGNPAGIKNWRVDIDGFTCILELPIDTLTRLPTEIASVELIHQALKLFYEKGFKGCSL